MKSIFEKTLICEDSAGLFSMEIATGIVYADRAVAETFGFSEETAKHGIQREEFYQRIAPEFRDSVAEIVSLSVESGEQIQITYTINRPDGSQVKALGFGQCFRSSDGEPQQYAGIVVPISEYSGKSGSDAISHLLAARESALQLGSTVGAQKIIEAIAAILTERDVGPSRH